MTEATFSDAEQTAADEAKAEYAAQAAADPTAQALVAGGAVPTEVDAAAMLKMIQDLQGQLASLQAQTGVVTDPVAAAKKDLADHVAARAAQYPTVDFSEVQNMIADLPDEPTPDHTNLTHVTVSEFTDKLRHLEVAYLKDLATTLHKAVLKKATQ